MHPMTAVAFLLAVLVVAYVVTAAAIWRTYRRNYRDGDS